LLSSYEEEQRFGILINDNIETYSAIIAILLSGKTYIPINPAHPAERIQRIIAQAELNVICSVSDTEQYMGLANINTTQLIAKRTAADIVIPTQEISGRNAYILFTSGSTGVPKGTPISYHNLDSFVRSFFMLGYDVSQQDRFLQMFDLTFDLSVMSYLVPLCIGACVYTIPEKGMKYTNIYGILEEHQITFALMVPSILSYLRPYFSEIDLPSMRYSLFCGEALLKDVVTEWAACVPNAVIENVYGPTEATIFCLTYPVNPKGEICDVNGIVAIGKPMYGMEAIVVDDDLRELAGNEKGELCLYGDQLTKGYLDDEKNKIAFFRLNDKKYYRTGDISSRLPDGNYVYCGRIDHQVKIQGFRVELSEIEHHVRASINGTNAIALAIDAGQGLNQIDIAIESSPMNTDQLLAALATKLPAYMMPTNVHYINPFPLNVNGKTDRKAIKDLITASA
jgi:amino acid adenylation domain-containing protein